MWAQRESVGDCDVHSECAGLRESRVGRQSPAGRRLRMRGVRCSPRASGARLQRYTGPVRATQAAANERGIKVVRPSPPAPKSAGASAPRHVDARRRPPAAGAGRAAVRLLSAWEGCADNSSAHFAARAAVCVDQSSRGTRKGLHVCGTGAQACRRFVCLAGGWGLGERGGVAWGPCGACFKRGVAPTWCDHPPLAFGWERTRRAAPCPASRRLCLGARAADKGAACAPQRA